MNLKKSPKFYNALYAALQGIYWTYYASLWSFIAVLLGLYGYSGVSVGAVTALATALSVLVQPLLAARADRSRRFRSREMALALTGVAFLTGLCLFLFPLSVTVRAVLFCFLGLMLFCISPFLNSLAMDITACGVPLNYGFGRGTGSLFYAVTVTLAGTYVSVRSPRFTLGVFLCLLAISFPLLLLCRLPDAFPRAAEEQPLSTLAFLRKHPTFTLAMLGSVFYMGSHNVFNTYYYGIVERTGVTGGLTMGLTLGIAAVVELPAMSLFSRFRRHADCARLLAVSSLAGAVKCLLFLFFPQVWMLYPNAVLQFFENGVYIPAAVYFVREQIGDADQSKGQGLMYAAASGLGGAFGNFFGGLLFDRFSIVAALIFGAVCGAVAVLCFLGCRRKDGKEF